MLLLRRAAVLFVVVLGCGSLHLRARVRRRRAGVDCRRVAAELATQGLAAGEVDLTDDEWEASRDMRLIFRADRTFSIVYGDAPDTEGAWQALARFTHEAG